MRKVDVLARAHSGQQARIRPHVERIPADVRNFFIAFGEACATFREVRQARLFGCFGGTGVKPLHADADAQERNATRNCGPDRGG